MLSVAALNRRHKRQDYLIAELAALPAPRPFLLLAGEPDAETPEVRAMATAHLGAGGFDMRTVPHAGAGPVPGERRFRARIPEQKCRAER